MEPYLPKISFSVYDWNRIGSHVFIGEFSISLADLEPNELYNRWFLLNPLEREENGKTKNLGEIRLALKYTEANIYPKAIYEEMFKILKEDDLIIPIALGEVSSEREESAHSLLKIFFARHKALLLLKALTSHEINSTENVDIIFRGNSIATKALDIYMKLVGSAYLQGTLGKFVTEMYKLKKSCETDPSKVEKGDDVKSNFKQLLKKVQEATHAIFESLDHCPP